MTAKLERRVCRTAIWARRLGTFSLALLLTAAFGHRYGFLPTPGLYSVGAVVVALALLALVLSASSFSRIWYAGHLGGQDMVEGAITALLALAPFLYFTFLGATLPPLTDVSTDPDDPPRMVAAQAERTPDMNRIALLSQEERRMQREHYPLVTGRRYSLPVDHLLAAVANVVADRGWKVTAAPAEGTPAVASTIEAVAHTPVLAFESDVAIRIVDEGDTVYVDMRSASRYGRHDFGSNAIQITEFLEDLERMATTVLPKGAGQDEPGG